MSRWYKDAGIARTPKHFVLIINTINKIQNNSFHSQIVLYQTRNIHLLDQPSQQPT
jgi:hypothetical protein